MPAFASLKFERLYKRVEIKFNSGPRVDRDGIFKNSVKTASAWRYLTWAAWNARSIYNREETVRDLMITHRIGFLMITEAFLRHGDPAQGLSEARAAGQGAMGGGDY